MNCTPEVLCLTFEVQFILRQFFIEIINPIINIYSFVNLQMNLFFYYFVIIKIISSLNHQGSSAIKNHIFYQPEHYEKISINYFIVCIYFFLF